MTKMPPQARSPAENGKRITVLHLFDALGRGGAAQVMVDMVTGLNNRKFAPSVCLTRPTDVSDQTELLARANIPIYALDRQGVLGFLAWRKLVELLHTTVILHSHSESSNAWARFWGILTGVPIIITQEHKAVERKSSIFQQIDRILGPLSTRIIAVSEVDRLRLISIEGQRAEKVVTIYNGTDIERFAEPLSKPEARIRAKLPIDGKLIAIIGRLEAQKGHDVFLKAANLLAMNLGEAVHFVVVGSGSRLLELQALAIDCEIQRQVLFLGERADVPTILKAVDGLVLSSSWECLPLILLEALAAECPVATTDVGGVREVLKNGEAGYLVPVSDIVGLADAMYLILTKPSETRIKSLVGFEWVNTMFSKTRMVQQLEGLYQELVRNYPDQQNVLERIVR